ncbi:MAG: glycosyltransferase [Chloroflexota bacterium]|nr:glycosyltransferase [Chloroflexota bacterium]
MCHLPPEVESHIVCENTENLEQFDVPHIHSLAQAPRWRYLWDKGLRRLKIRRHLGFLVEVAKQYQAQVLHSHFGNSGWANLAAARKANLKHVVTFYGLDVTYLPRSQSYWLERYQTLFAQVDCVLCEGPFMAQSIVALGCPEHKVRVHHLGVNVDEIPFKPRVWRATEPLRVLIAASFREKKGIPYALEALGRFQREVPLEITLIGDAGQETRSQAEKQKIMATFTKHHLLSKTRLLGYQPYTVLLEEAYKHHVFLSPSVTASDGDTEGGAPVSLIDMMASGIPIVSTTHCDIPEVVQDGITGLLAEERDVDGLVDHLKWLVDHPDRWQSMLEAGRTYVEREYNARVQGERLGVIYSQLCRNRYE